MDGREEEYQLAGPYLYTRRVFVVKKDSDIRELSDLVGKTIALQAGSIAGVRILVVEDNELNMEIAEYMFTERGAVVEKAADGKKALEMFAASEEGSGGWTGRMRRPSPFSQCQPMLLMMSQGAGRQE